MGFGGAILLEIEHIVKGGLALLGFAFAPAKESTLGWITGRFAAGNGQQRSRAESKEVERGVFS